MEDESLDEPFLARWSRRKLEAKDEAPAAPLPAGAPQPEFHAAASAPGTESDAAAATPGTGPEYREFFDPRVEEKQRRTALRKLFSEPQFNVMDGLDTYIDDYTKADPIPQAMLRRLNQAKSLFLFDDEKPDADAGVPSPAAPASAGESLSQAPDAIAAADAAAASLAHAGTAAAEPPADGSKND